MLEEYVLASSWKVEVEGGTQGVEVGVSVPQMGWQLPAGRNSIYVGPRTCKRRSSASLGYAFEAFLTNSYHQDFPRARDTRGAGSLSERSWFAPLMTRSIGCQGRNHAAAQVRVFYCSPTTQGDWRSAYRQFRAHTGWRYLGEQASRGYL